MEYIELNGECLLLFFIPMYNVLLLLSFVVILVLNEYVYKCIFFQWSLAEGVQSKMTEPQFESDCLVFQTSRGLCYLYSNSNRQTGNVKPAECGYSVEE